MILTLIFWILLVLAAIGAFAADSKYPWLGYGRWIVALILIAILGYFTFGNPIHK